MSQNLLAPLAVPLSRRSWARVILCAALVGWYDQDHRENAILRMPVSDPDTLGDADIDHLLEPSFDPTLLAEVNTLFVKHGLDPAKVRSVSLDCRRLYSFIQATGYHPVTFQHLHERANP
jgi:hypothetical protein